MAERSEQRPRFSSLNRFEQLALMSTILIWVGAIAFGIGLAVALYNLQIERVAFAKAASSMATAAGPEAAGRTATETAAAAPTSTARLYPAGWSTATPTPSPTPTRSPALATMRVAPDETRPLTASSLPERDEPLAPAATPTPPRHPPDRLVIPAIDLDSAIVPTGWTTVEQDGQTSRVWNVVDQVVGWHETSALPGSAGNVVLNGHHNIRGEVFRYLIDVEVGDRLTLYARDQAFDYAVTEKHILKEKGEPLEVRLRNAIWMEPTLDERVTMITCWPYTDNTHRLIVVAKPTSVPGTEELERSQTP